MDNKEFLDILAQSTKKYDQTLRKLSGIEDDCCPAQAEYSALDEANGTSNIDEDK